MTSPAPGPEAAPAEAAIPAEPAKRARKSAAKKDKATDDAPAPPISVDLVLPPPVGERPFELDEDPVHDPVPNIDPAVYVAEVFAQHRADFGRDQQQAELIVFDAAELAALPEPLRKQAQVVDLTTPDGLAIAEREQETFRRHRLATERTHKRYKEPFYKIGKLIDTTKNTLVEAISGCEQRFASAIRAEQERQAAEQEKLVQIELARVAALRQRIEAIRAVTVQAFGLPPAALRALVAEVEATDAAGFAEYAELAAQAKADTLRALAAALAAAERVETQLAELTRYQHQFGALPPAPAPAWADLAPDEVLTAAPAPDEAPAAAAFDRALALALLMAYRCLTGSSGDSAGAIANGRRLLLRAGFSAAELAPRVGAPDPS
jgi:hypothetical protein